MVFIARGLMGSAALFGSSVIYTYIGEIGTYMDRSRRKMGKKPMKDVLYMANTLASNGWYFGLLGKQSYTHQVLNVVSKPLKFSCSV